MWASARAGSTPAPGILLFEMSQPTLSIILINYRYFEDLKSAVNSILQSHIDFPTEIIVVNVPSNDGTEEFVANLNPENPLISVKLVQAEGFSISGLRNMGINHASGKYILLMDTDLTLHPKALSRAISFMENNPDVGIAGFNLTHEDGTSQFNGRSFPTPMTILARRTPLGKLFPSIELRHLYADADRDRNMEVDWVSGATMLIRHDVIERIGLLDERYRYGFEDVDFCYRAKKAGWKVAVIADARGIHREMRRSTRSLWFACQHLKSAFFYFLKHGWRSLFGKI